MEPLGVLGEAMRRFTELLVDADPDLPVPACADWTVLDLTAHLGQIHRWSAGIVLSGQQNRKPEVRPTEPLAEWYASQATALLAALAAVADEEPAPNFTRRDETARFWKRRQAHETVVHCVDLAQATQTGFGVTPEIGADGVDEVVRVFVPMLLGRGSGVDLPGPVTVRATDVDRAWTLSPGGETVAVVDEARSEAVIVGTASELYLGLWGRGDRDRLTVRGASAERFLAGRVTP